MVSPGRFDVWIVSLNPTVGTEIKKTRPCVVVSPDVVNKYLNTVTIVPLTSTLKTYPTRVDCRFENKDGQLAVDQLRSVDKSRLIKRMGKIGNKYRVTLCNVLIEYFKY